MDNQKSIFKGRTEMQYIPAIIFSIVLFVIAIFLKRGKGLWLIAGFNVMSTEERNAYDMMKIGKFVSKILTGMALCLLAFDFGWHINNPIAIVLPWVAFGGIAIFALVYVKVKNDKFKKGI